MGPTVSDIMATDVVTIGIDETMAMVGRRLYEEGVGSLIVKSADGVPMGIVTTEDLLRAITQSEKVLSAILVSEYMSRPLLKIDEERPVRSAVRKMNQEGVEQLAIVDEYEVVGIVAQTDVIDSYESLIQAAHQSERRPDD